MSFPKHKNPSKGRHATAPYNFVALADEIVHEIPRVDHDIYHVDRYTGVLHCTLKTETPLYTRAALEPAESKKKMQAKEKADFFYVDPETKRPVIPGSGIRGALRTLMEIITYSKPQPVTDRQLFFRTLDDSAIGKAYGKRMVAGERGQEGSYPNVKAGYMERVGHDYRIRPAQSLHGTQFFRVEDELAISVIPELQPMRWYDQRAEKWKEDRNYKKNGWKRCAVWFRPVAPTYHDDSAQLYADITELSAAERSPGTGYVQGWLIASGWVPSKGKGKHRHWIVAPPSTEQTMFIDIMDIDIDAYDELNAGRSQTIETQKMSVLPKEPGKLIPCFYTEWKDSSGNERIAFGHTAMFRLPYEYSPQDLLPYSKDQMASTDFAEAIFGWVDDQKGRTIAGRVSVGDAHVPQDFPSQICLLNKDEESLTPLLSGPKPTTFQHYLTQGSDEKNELYHYQDEGSTTLRGHKLYWHKDGKLERTDYHTPKTSENEKQLTTMRPVNKGVFFDFDIHFENLAAEELGALLWILQVAGDGNHCLKIGMAKPLGLGSVSIQSRLCLSGRSARYRSLFENGQWQKSSQKIDAEETAEKPVQFAELKQRLQERAEVALSDWTLFIHTFERYVLDQLGETNREFSQLLRVQTLLTLLRWPGPNREHTKYMELGKFRQRPVLPDPLWITDPSRQTERNTQQNKRPERTTPPPQRAANTELAGAFTEFMNEKLSETVADESEQPNKPASQSEPTKLTSTSELAVGLWVQGVVTTSNFIGLTVDLGLMGIKATLRTEDSGLTQTTLQDSYPTDEPIAAYIKELRMKKNKGTVYLSLQPPP